MTDCCNKERQQIAVFALCNGDRRRVEIGLYTSVMFPDRGVKVDGTYYYDLLLSQQLLSAICHASSEFMF